LASNDGKSDIYGQAPGFTCNDRMHELLVKLGANVLDAPQYNDGKGYYAVFFADCDGLKLECVFTPS